MAAAPPPATDAAAAPAAAPAAAAPAQQATQQGQRRVAVAFDAVMEMHLREGHPEHPARVQVLNRRLQEAHLLERCSSLPPGRLATDEELLACHSQAHIDRVDKLYDTAPLMGKDDGSPLDRLGDTFIITGDIYCNSHTRLAARSAAGCAVQAVEAVLGGEADSAFAIVRPPGHHAETDEFMGFCFFNNVSVAAAAALRHPGVERVLILDWDVHHGNGSESIWLHDPRVLVVSLHRRDANFYPIGRGYETDVGAGPGAGFNVNVPWSSKGVGDADYLAAFELLLQPVMAAFDPQLVLISAGFDAAEGDILGKCCVTAAGFAAMTSALLQLAGGRVVAVLEGGYVPEIVSQCVSAVLARLLGDAVPPPPAAGKLHKCALGVLARVEAVMRPFWPSLAALPAFDSRFADYKAAHKAAAALEALSLQPRVTRRQQQQQQAASSASSAVAASAEAAAAADGPAASSSEQPDVVVRHSNSSRNGSAAASLAARAPPLSGRKPAAKATAATAAPAAAATASTAPTPAAASTAPAAAPAAPAAPAGKRVKIKIKMPRSMAGAMAPQPAAAAAAAAAGASAGPGLSSSSAAAVPGASTSADQQQHAPGVACAAPVPPAAVEDAAPQASLLAQQQPAAAAGGSMHQHPSPLSAPSSAASPAAAAAGTLPAASPPAGRSPQTRSAARAAAKTPPRAAASPAGPRPDAPPAAAAAAAAAVLEAAMPSPPKGASAAAAGVSRSGGDAAVSNSTQPATAPPPSPPAAAAADSGGSREPPPSPPAGAGPSSSSSTSRGGSTTPGACVREETPFEDASSDVFRLSASFSGLTMHQQPATPPPSVPPSGCAAADVLAAAAVELPSSPEPAAADEDAGLEFVSP